MVKTPPKMIFCALDWTVLFTPFGSSKACWNLGCHLVVILQFCCTYTTKKTPGWRFAPFIPHPCHPWQIIDIPVISIC